MTTRIEEIEQDLAAVREQIRKAERAITTSVDGRTLTNQGLAVLERREMRLEWALRVAKSGSTWGQQTVLPRPGQGGHPVVQSAVPTFSAGGHGYTYWQAWNPTTPMPFGAAFAGLTLPIAIPADTPFSLTLLNTVIEHLQPGDPFAIDYEGSVVVATGTSVNLEVDLGYRIWPGMDRQFTSWREFLGLAFVNQPLAVPGNSFSHQGIFGVGTVVPTDAGGMTTFTAADFADGLPVQIILRVLGHAAFSLEAPSIDVQMTELDWLQPQLVVTQLPIAEMRS